MIKGIKRKTCISETLDSFSTSKYNSHPSHHHNLYIVNIDILSVINNIESLKNRLEKTGMKFDCSVRISLQTKPGLSTYFCPHSIKSCNASPQREAAETDRKVKRLNPAAADAPLSSSRNYEHQSSSPTDLISDTETKMRHESSGDFNIHRI